MKTSLFRSATFQGCALVLLAIIVSYANIVFLGQTLVPSANYHPFDVTFEHLRPTRPGNTAFLNWYDQGANWWQAEPAGKFFSRRYRRGDIPFWDPTISGGTSAHTNVTQAQYFPPYMLVLLAGDSPSLRDFYYLALVLGSGLATLGLLRANGVGPLAAAAGGIAFALSGTMTMNVNSVPGQSYAMLPVMVWAADWALRRRDLFSLSIASMLIALGTLSSFFPVAISGYVLIGFLFAVHLWMPGPEEHGQPFSRRSFRVTARFVTIVALSILLCAFLLLPFATTSLGASSFERWYARAGESKFLPDDLLTLVSPRISYDVVQSFPGSEIIPRRTPSSSAFFYVGTVALLLVLISGPADRTARRLFVFALVGAVFVLMKLLGLPPAQWLVHIPPFGRIHYPPYFCGALTLCTSLLVGIAVDGLTRQAPSKRQVTILFTAAALLIAAVIHFVVSRDTLPPLKLFRWVIEFATVAGSALGLLAVVVARRRGRLSGTVAGFAVLALLSAQLVYHTYRPRNLRHDVWSDPPDYVRFLLDDPSLFRVHSVHEIALTANVYQGLGLSGLASRHVFHPARFESLIRTIFETPPNQFLLPRSVLPSNPGALDLLNVKYLITRDLATAGRLERFGFQRALHDSGYLVYRNPYVWPRAFLAAGYEFAPNAEDALQRVAAMQEGPQLVLEDRPVQVAESGGSAVSDTGEVRVVEYTPDRVELATAATTPSVLVLLDSHAPGWSVTVNGRPAPVLRANYAFRGVEVPPGPSQVVFSYRVPRIRSGSAVSLIALLVCAALLPFRRNIVRQRGELTGTSPEIPSGSTRSANPDVF